MKSEYTKGEWRIDTGSIATVVVADSGKVAVVYGGSDKEEEANARLIAQAPKLYELAKIIADEAPWKIDPEWQQMARQALASVESK